MDREREPAKRYRMQDNQMHESLIDAWVHFTDTEIIQKERDLLQTIVKAHDEFTDRYGASQRRLDKARSDLEKFYSFYNGGRNLEI